MPFAKGEGGKTERRDFPPFPTLPSVAELTPARIRALTVRMNHAERDAKAFEAEGPTCAAAYYRGGTEVIEALLAQWRADSTASALSSRRGTR